MQGRWAAASSVRVAIWALITLACLWTFFPAHSNAQLTSSTDGADVSVKVRDTELRIQGKTAPKSMVTVVSDGVVAGTTSANKQGRFTVNLFNQSPGLHDIKVFARDKNNRLTDTINKTINVIEKDLTVFDVFLPPVLYVDNSPPSVTQGETVTVKGTAFPGSTVVVRVDNNLTFSTGVSQQGTWRFSFSTPSFYIGTHVVAALATDNAGQSQLSLSRIFEVTPAPVAPLIITSEPPTPRITHPISGNTVDSQKVHVEGVAQPNSQVELYDGETLLGSIFASNKGEWALPILMQQSEMNLRARACNEFGCGEYSDIVLLVPSDGMNSFRTATLELSEYSYQDVEAGDYVSLVVRYSGSGPYDALIDWGDGVVERVSFNDKSAIELKHRYQKSGRYSGHVSLLDESGVIDSRYFSAFVIERQSISWQIIAGGVSGTLAIIGIGYLWHHQHAHRYVRSSAHPRFT